MKIEIKDKKTVLIDGEEYIRKEDTTPESKFKVGDWVIRIVEFGTPHNKGRVFRVTGINWGSLREGDVIIHCADSCRLATPVEIESHLRKICEEKYVGKRVRCLIDGEIYTVTSAYHKNNIFNVKEDCYWVTDGCWGVKVYSQGKWAEIIPDKKPLPKTREEFTSMLSDFESYDNPIMGVGDFLDQYNFKD